MAGEREGEEREKEPKPTGLWGLTHGTGVCERDSRLLSSSFLPPSDEMGCHSQTPKGSVFALNKGHFWQEGCHKITLLKEAYW